jgi:hypothetical protein
MHKEHLSRRILLLEAGSFLAIVAVMWLDEVLDLPHHLFGFQATPVNWIEGLIESGMVLCCAALIIPVTHALLRRIRCLHGLLPICSSCKRVRDDHGYWQQIEAYIRDHSEADFSHGLCPDCCQRLYPQFYVSGGLAQGGAPMPPTGPVA